MPYILQVDSDNQVTVYPEFNSEFGASKVEDRHRTRTAKEFVYRWAGYKEFKVPVQFVNSSFKAVVNSWWDTNVILQWYEQGTTDVTTVYLTGRDQPIGGFIAPYDNLFQGTLRMEESK